VLNSNSSIGHAVPAMVTARASGIGKRICKGWIILAGRTVANSSCTVSTSEPQIVAAAKRLVEDGKYELAAYLLDSCQSRFTHSEDFSKVERLVYFKLMEKYQNNDPFKFIIYASKAGAQLPQMPVTGRRNEASRKAIPTFPAMGSA